MMRMVVVMLEVRRRRRLLLRLLVEALVVLLQVLVVVAIWNVGAAATRHVQRRGGRRILAFPLVGCASGRRL